jgi:hypothetical protein
VEGTGHPPEAVIRAETDWMRKVWVALAGDESLGAALQMLDEGAIVAHMAGGRDDAVATARAAAIRLVGDRATTF